jgi:hypothetical protein
MAAQDDIFFRELIALIGPNITSGTLIQRPWLVLVHPRSEFLARGETYCESLRKAIDALSGWEGAWREDAIFIDVRPDAADYVVVVLDAPSFFNRRYNAQFAQLLPPLVHCSVHMSHRLRVFLRAEKQLARPHIVLTWIESANSVEASCLLTSRLNLSGQVNIRYLRSQAKDIGDLANDCSDVLTRGEWLFLLTDRGGRIPTLGRLASLLAKRQVPLARLFVLGPPLSKGTAYALKSNFGIIFSLCPPPPNRPPPSYSALPQEVAR